MEKKNVKVVGRIDLTRFEKKEKEKQIEHDIKPKFPQEEIHFFSDKNKRIVGRSKSGKIAIISYEFKGAWVKDGEDWLCDVVKVEENKIIVMPIGRTISAEENFNESLVKINNLKESGFKKEFTKSKNTRLYYQTK